ncbi:hypothetical protein [Kocuria rosea]|jgi:hypothetical protein|uniref:hypothetical protein n=1 Tax=Kocuria rosea TaxID=1275 RepID=UPI00203DD1FB|nr:hypothetical protein [Kocuria rosea]MCM3687299.1 hypothetical protein [Kocuria rosea]
MDAALQEIRSGTSTIVHGDGTKELLALWEHADMLFRPRYRALGLIALPHTMLATVIPLVFLPLTVVVAGLDLAAGNWVPLLAVAAFVAGLHAIICVIALRMVGESWAHLLVVPLYRVTCEPLRAYLLCASLLQALKGKLVGWYHPARTNTVPDLTARQDRTARGADLTRETAGVGIRSPPHSPREFLLIITGLVSQYGRRTECSFPRSWRQPTSAAPLVACHTAKCTHSYLQLP